MSSCIIPMENGHIKLLISRPQMDSLQKVQFWWQNTPAVSLPTAFPVPPGSTHSPKKKNESCSTNDIVPTIFLELVPNPKRNTAQRNPDPLNPLPSKGDPLPRRWPRGRWPWSWRWRSSRCSAPSVLRVFKRKNEVLLVVRKTVLFDGHMKGIC